MKKNKKLLTLPLAATLAVTAAFAFAACTVVNSASGGGSSNSASDSAAPAVDYKVSESNREIVVFTVTGDVMTLTDATSMYDYMVALQESGKVTFEIKDGMITKVNGVENPSDYSSCWMIYTDLGEYEGVSYSNREWGTYTYGENTYNSAAYGVTAMPAIEGYTYILHYDTF